MIKAQAFGIEAHLVIPILKDERWVTCLLSPWQGDAGGLIHLPTDSAPMRKDLSDKAPPISSSSNDQFPF